MIKKIGASKKAKNYVIGLCIAATILIIASLFYPVALNLKAYELLEDKALSIASSVATTTSSLAQNDITSLRSNPDSQSQSYKKLNTTVSTLARELSLNRIFVVYKGIGGKYFYLLDSQNAISAPGIEVDDKYLKHKSVLDKISDKKITAQCPSSTVDTDLGKALIAWHSLTNEKGDVIAVLGVECVIANYTFNKLEFGKLNIIALAAMASAILGIICIVIAVKIWQSSKKKRITKADFEQMPTLSQLQNEVMEDKTTNENATVNPEENSDEKKE